MCCAEFLVKYILFFFNLVFALAGLALIGAGIAFLVGIQELTDVIQVDLSGFPIFVIVIGAFIFIVAFSGCCGAIRESRCLIIMYAVFMIILAGAKIFLVVILNRELSALQTTVEGWINQAFADHGTDGSGTFQALEVAFRCCGTTGSESYASVGIIPGSCCAEPVNNLCTAADSYSGCTDRIGGYFETYGEIIWISIIVIIVIELIAMVFALFLNHRITNKNRASNYY